MILHHTSGITVRKQRHVHPCLDTLLATFRYHGFRLPAQWRYPTGVPNPVPRLRPNAADPGQRRWFQCLHAGPGFINGLLCPLQILCFRPCACAARLNQANRSLGRISLVAGAPESAVASRFANQFGLVNSWGGCLCFHGLKPGFVGFAMRVGLPHVFRRPGGWLAAIDA